MLLAGFLKPLQGEIHWQGQPLQAWHAGELARRRALLPQQTVLPFAYTVLQVIEMGRAPHLAGGLKGPLDREVVQAALDRTGLLGLQNRPYPELSGGQQKRVHLARVLAQLWASGPEAAQGQFLLLDEPLAGLDLRHQLELLKLVHQQANAGACVVAVLHEVNQALAFATHAALLKAGQVLAQGPAQDVLTAESASWAYDLPMAEHQLGSQKYLMPALE